MTEVLWSQPFITAITAVLDACLTFELSSSPNNLVNITRPDPVFAYSQLYNIRDWYTFNLLSDCYNMYVVLMIKELRIVTLELK
jgi:hypothetical protein